MDVDVYKKMGEVESGHWWYKARKKIIETRLHGLLPKPNIRLLDVGCGSGLLTEALGEFGTAIGCDSSVNAPAFQRTNATCAIVSTADLLNRTELHGSFQVICFFDVIEHAQDDRALIEEYLPYLAEGGLIIITVPAFSFFWGHHDVVSRHFRRYTKGRVSRLLSDCGFEPVTSTYFNCFLSPLVLVSRLLERVLPAKSAAGDLEKGNPVADWFFYSVFRSEAWLLGHLNLPFGVSFFGAYRKKNHST